MLLFFILLYSSKIITIQKISKTLKLKLLKEIPIFLKQKIRNEAEKNPETNIVENKTNQIEEEKENNDLVETEIVEE